MIDEGTSPIMGISRSFYDFLRSTGLTDQQIQTGGAYPDWSKYEEWMKVHGSEYSAAQSAKTGKRYWDYFVPAGVAYAGWFFGGPVGLVLGGVAGWAGQHIFKTLRKTA